MQDMTSGQPLKLIIKFSIPLLIGNLFQQLYSISDIIIVGRLIGIKALAAVGVSAPLFFMLVMVSIGFTNGLTVITAQRFGAHDYRGMRRSVTTAAVLSTVFTLAASATMLFFLDDLFTLMNVPEDILADAKRFTTVISYGVITMVFFNLLSGFLRALGDSKTPLYFLIFTTLLNIVFNVVFIYYFRMGVVGSALGTICAMSAAVVCCLIYIGVKCPLLRRWRCSSRLSPSATPSPKASATLSARIPLPLSRPLCGLSSWPLSRWFLSGWPWRPMWPKTTAPA